MNILFKELTQAVLYRLGIILGFQADPEEVRRMTEGQCPRIRLITDGQKLPMEIGFLHSRETR